MTGATLAIAFFVTVGAAFTAGFVGGCFVADGFVTGFSAGSLFGVAFFAGVGELTAFATVLPAPFTGAVTERFAAVGAVEAGGAAWRFAAVLVPATRRPLAC
jgi:hypothetical protein